MSPQVRVITKMFNEAAFLDVFIAHYLSQDIECMVLFDDCSTDDSVSRAVRWGRRVQVRRLERNSWNYDRASDEWLCQELFSIALQLTDLPTWWLFPDIDELIRPGPGLPGTLAEALRSLSGVDGVPCVGLHCLPRVAEDPRFGLSPEALLSQLNAVAPPRSFELPHKHGAAWKTPIWLFDEDARERYRGLRPSSGNHLLLGNTAHLHYARPAWPLFHYKVRQVTAFLEHTDQQLARVPTDSPYQQLYGTTRDRVAGWATHRFRILRLGRVLSTAAIADACQSAMAPGVYYETPFRPGVWGCE